VSTSLVTLQDLTLSAIESLTRGGYKSFSIGDQIYTYQDLDKLWEQYYRLSQLIEAESNTSAGTTQTAVVSFGSIGSSTDD